MQLLVEASATCYCLTILYSMQLTMLLIIPAVNSLLNVLVVLMFLNSSMVDITLNPQIMVRIITTQIMLDLPVTHLSLVNLFVESILVCAVSLKSLLQVKMNLLKHSSLRHFLELLFQAKFKDITQLTGQENITSFKKLKMGNMLEISVITQ